MLLAAIPAQAACTEEGNTTTCTGDVSTSANGAPAILALGDEVTLNSTGTLTTTGDVSAGIGALRNFTYDGATDQGTFDAGATSVSVTNQGDITTGGEESYGIAAGATLGTASVMTAGTISTAGDYSHGIVATGQNVVIDLDGNISTEGAAADGILVADFAMIDGEAEIVGRIAGNAAITAGSVAASGDSANGIRVGAEGDVSITSDAVDLTGTATDPGTGPDGLRIAQGGIIVEGGDGAIAIDAGTVDVAGEYRYGISARGNGAIDIAADAVNLASADSVAVAGRGGAGDVSIVTGTVTTTGASGAGVLGRSTSGNVTIDASITRVENAGFQGPFTGDAVTGISDTGFVTIASEDAFSAALYGSAVAAFGGGVVIDSGKAETTGNQGVAVFGVASLGDAVVSAAETMLSGSGPGTLGILVRSDNGDASLAVGALTATGTQADGAFAQADNGTASVVTTGNVAVTGGYALRGQGSAVAVETGEGTTTSGTTGILVNSTGTASVTNAGTVIATGGLGSAVHVTAPGAVSVISDAVQVTGAGADPGVRGDGSGYRLEQGGIIVEGGAGAVSIDAGTVDVTGEHRYGISVRGNGAIGIAADDVTLASADSVAVVARGGAGDVSITTGTVTTTGASGVGVFGNTTTGTVTIDAGITRVENEGIAGLFTGDAVVATSQSGSVSIASQDAFSAGSGGSAVVGISGGNVAIDSGVAETTGDGGIAVYGQSSSGDVTIAAADTATSGDGTIAVYGRADAGNATLDVGTLTATGTAATGAFARADAGTATITTSGGVTVADGVALRGQGATVAIGTGEGAVTSGTTGIRVNSSGSASVTNVGTAIGSGAGASAIEVNAGGDVSVVSDTVSSTGDNGFGIFAKSSNGSVTIDSASATTSGAYTSVDDVAAIFASAIGGTALVRVGDVTATGQDAAGVLATGLEANVTVDGTIATGGFGVIAHSAEGTTHVVVSGAVTSNSASAAGVASVSQNGLVEIAEGASVTGAVGVALIGGTQGGFSELHNSGTIHGTEGPAVGGTYLTSPASAPSVYIRNDGTLTTDGESAVITEAGDDVLELTERSVVVGLVDLGGGDNILLLNFNDGVTDGVGQVASTANVGHLDVASGSWLANGAQSDYDDVTIAAGATLTVGENADGDTGIATSQVALDGTLNLAFVTDTLPGDLTGLTIVGGGSLHLTGEATILVDDASGLQYTGGTFVENGEFLLTDVFGGDITTSGDGVFELAAGGDFTGNLVNDGTFVFSRTDDYSFLGDFSGSGLLAKYGDGTLTFAGLYAFEGTTSLFGGTVAFTGQLSEDTELDLSQGTVDLSQVEGGEQTIAQLSGTGGTLELGETQLVIDQSDNTVFAGEIEGSGTIQKEGEGDLKLEGDGTGFTGTGQVDGGTLSVNGDFSNADFVVNGGGTLGGAGTVGDTTVNGGALAPGNSIDTLNINGDVTFTAASVYEVEVDAAGNGDRINATGTATLGGAAVNVIAASGTYRPLTDYTILTAAGGVSGTFGSVQDNLAFLDPSLIYSTNAVTLRLVRNDIDFAAFGTTANQVAVGGLIESLGYGNTLYDETLMLVDDDVAPSFASLTGEVYPAYSAGLIETAEVLRRQTADATQHAEGAYAWTTGLYNNVDSGSGAGEIDLKGRGLAGGFGFATDGFSASAGVGILDQEGGGSQFSDGEVTFAIGRLAYIGMPGLSVSAGAQFGWVDGQTRRQTTLGTINQAVTGQIEGDYLQVFGEVAYRLPVGNGLGVEPFVGVSHVSLDLDNVTETGAPTALAVAAIDRAVTFADVGLRLSGEVGSGVRPFASAAYRHAWGDRPSVAAFGFAGTAGTALVGAVPIAKSAGELEAGLVVTRGMIDFEVGVDATISEGFDSHGVNAGFKVRF